MPVAADSLADASAALRLGSPRSGTDIAIVAIVAIVDIADLRVLQLLDAAGHAARARFVDTQLVRLVNESSYVALRDSLIAWCESGFNLVGTARRLSIHRNTVVYRLDKVAGMTGRDVRDPKIAVAMYLACLV